MGTRYLKQGALITSAENSWPPPLPFHTALKIPQPNIFTLSYTYPCMRECECVSVCVWVCCLSMWVSLFVMVNRVNKARICSAEEWVCVCVWEFVSVCVCLSKWVSVFVMMSQVDKAWICSTEEFLELHGKVEPVVRNCLLRWSRHLFEVPSTHLFDQCFYFKHICLFCALIWAFFRWYAVMLNYWTNGLH